MSSTTITLPSKTVERIAAMAKRDSAAAHGYINTHLTADIMNACEQATTTEPDVIDSPAWPAPLIVRGRMAASSVSIKDVRLDIEHNYSRFELDRMPWGDVVVTVVPATREQTAQGNPSDAGPKVNKPEPPTPDPQVQEGPRISIDTMGDRERVVFEIGDDGAFLLLDAAGPLAQETIRNVVAAHTKALEGYAPLVEAAAEAARWLDACTTSHGDTGNVMVGVRKMRSVASNLATTLQALNREVGS
jgi:hypothetical protein